MGPESTQKMFPADATKLRDVLSFVAGVDAWLKLDSQRSTEFQVAIEEAFINISCHSSQEPGRSVLVRVRGSDAAIEVEFEDRNAPFDPLLSPEPANPSGLDEASVGGLGIELMRRMADEIHYCRRGDRNILTLVAHTPSGSDR